MLKYDIRTGAKKIKTKIDVTKSLMGLVALALPAVVFLSAGGASAATTVVVTPANEQGWSDSPPLADTRPGGAVNFVADTTAPAGDAALQLTTNLTTSAKAQYMHEAGIDLSEVTELSFYTKQNSATFVEGAPSYQLPICLTGFNGAACNPGEAGTTGPTSFTTLVYEPYQGGSGPVIPNTWQQWDVDAGLFWSTRTVVCSNGVIAGGAGGPAIHTLTQVKAACPEAFVLSFGVNIGTFNPGYDVETDLFNFNGTTYNFELTNEPSSKDDCKKGGWMGLTDQNGDSFKNQGQCVSWTNGRGQ